MSGRCYHKCFIHLNWHCAQDAPLIKPALEKALYDFYISYCTQMKNLYLIEANGTETHSHLVMQFAPDVLLSDAVGKIKGASAYEMNRRFGPSTLKWQRGYGVVTFAERDLPGVRRYVQMQKEHHRQSTTRAGLEIHDEAMETEFTIAEVAEWYYGDGLYRPG